jgi:hypothetical protein
MIASVWPGAVRPIEPGFHRMQGYVPASITVSVCPYAS